MRWAHRLLGLLLGVLLIGLLFRILLPAFQGGAAWNEFLVAVAADQRGVIVVCLGLILGLVAFVLTGITAHPRNRYLAYETEFGTISISLKALQEFLGHLKGEFPTILALNPRVTAFDESLEVVMEIRVRSGAPIPEISRLLQERTRVIIQEKIGISDIRGIEVKVEEIVKEKDSKSQEITPVPPPAGEVP